MSAEVLRRAASLMRERAQAATDAPWVVERAHPDMPAYVAHEGWWVIASRTEQWDAEHIASWHPAVALAVADWLDSAADRFDQATTLAGADADHAVTVARAYLGSDA